MNELRYNFDWNNFLESYDLDIDLANLFKFYFFCHKNIVFLCVPISIFFLKKKRLKRKSYCNGHQTYLYMKMVQILYNLKIATTTEAPRLNGIYL